MRELLASLRQLARAPGANVLLQGERGSGRRHLARHLHQATFPHGSFISIDSPNVLHLPADRSLDPTDNSAHSRAAGTTIYVPEVAQLDARAQLRLHELSRRICESPYPVRLVVGSSIGLAEAARTGKFRRELIYRFPSVLEIPPLRSRRVDIEPLLSSVVRAVARRYGLEPVAFSPAALEFLVNAEWAGNVAELCEVVERVALLNTKPTIELDAIPELKQRRETAFLLPAEGLDLVELEKDLLQQALELSGRNQTRAAALVGLTRDQLRYRMMKFEFGMH